MTDALYSTDGVNFDHQELVTALEEAQTRGLIDEHGLVTIYVGTRYDSAPRSISVAVDINRKKTIRGFLY